jgi:hypothetical protein
VIDLEASDGGSHAAMGEALTAARNDRVSWAAHITGASASTVHWLVDGNELPTLPPQPVGDAGDDRASWIVTASATGCGRRFEPPMARYNC